MENVSKDNEKTELIISVLGTLFKGHPERVININSDKWGALYGEKPLFTDELILKLDKDFLKISDAIAQLVRDEQVDSVLEEVGLFDKLLSGKRARPMWFITTAGKYFVSAHPLMFAETIGYPEKELWDDDLIFSACNVYIASINGIFFTNTTLSWVNENILNNEYKIRIDNLPKEKYKEDNEPTKELIKIVDDLCDFHKISLTDKFDNFRNEANKFVEKNITTPEVKKLKDEEDLNSEARKIVEYITKIAKNLYDKQSYENDIKKFFEDNFPYDEKHDLETQNPYVFPDKYPLTLHFSLDSKPSIEITTLETKDYGDIHLDIFGPSYDDWVVDSDMLSEDKKGTLFEVLTIEKNIKTNDIEPTFNDEKTITEKIKVLHRLLDDTINMQFLMAGYSQNEKKPNSDFVIGYIIGYADWFLIRNGIDNNSPEGFSVPSIALMNIYGVDEGPKLFNRFLDSQINMSDEMTNGRKAGHEDGSEWGKENPTPHRLSMHLNKERH